MRNNIVIGLLFAFALALSAAEPVTFLVTVNAGKYHIEDLQPQQQYQLQAEAIDARGQTLHSWMVDFQTAGVGAANPKTVYGQMLSINGQAEAN